MRFLLRPGWIALIVGVLAFVVACYTLLAPWQFDRESERDAAQRAIDTANTTPPVPFATLVPGDEVPADLVWRQVSLTGEFLPGSDVLVRLRTLDGGPALDVLTAMRLTDGRTVTVDRGSVPAVDRGIPTFAPAPTGQVTVEGRLRTNETDPNSRPPLRDAAVPQVYAMDSRELAAATGLTPLSGVVTLSAGTPGVLRAIPVEVPTGGAPFTNFSYALQWITFGAVAIVALGIFIRLELLQRKGTRTSRGSLRDALSGRDEDGPDGADGPGTPAGSAGQDAGAAAGEAGRSGDDRAGSGRS
ncbi:SURF1 family protein [Pseudonocardia endophytica]|uniref:SURF1-like protein n=1 Tax=Pseudonocardia endophytica TaxID=401976 RepID=A0A4R1HYE2_PSEEN|nr:SURF1 family cytochrome oxidase biogenesis protein [Pseudonocardia endophytica]TCK25109.1 cytochrome oxidase assembly protein ShyY1 [Pseudonocardia endophytica]